MLLNSCKVKYLFVDFNSRQHFIQKSLEVILVPLGSIFTRILKDILYLSFKIFSVYKEDFFHLTILPPRTHKPQRALRLAGACIRQS